MAAWLEVRDYIATGNWPTERARWYCEQLERNEILYFPAPPFPFSSEDRQFLLSQRASDSRLHKNVSYRPTTDVLRGFSGDESATERMHRILREYSADVTEFVARFLAPYGSKVLLDYASFRPLEEEGRDLPLHKRNDLLHVDAFPSRPTKGGRILRVFTNVSERDRVWITTDRFTSLAQRYARDAGLPQIASSSAGRKVAHLLHSVGLPVADRSAYDQFMLRFHDWLKENTAFQSDCPKIKIEFPPMSTWLVFTDGVPHAVLSGQYALEQTFIVPPEALVSPQDAPIRVLEKIAAVPLGR